MNLRRHTFFKGDSYEFTVKLDSAFPHISGWDVEFLLSSNPDTVDTSPVLQLYLDSEIVVTPMDDGAEMRITFSPDLTQELPTVRYFYKIKITSGDKKITIDAGIVDFQTLMGDYYVSRFRRFIKDEKTKNKGEFLNTIENTDEDLLDYIHRAVMDFNSSFYITEFTIDTFKDETLLFTGALLQALISNGVISARCALTYQDVSGIVIADMDRWGRYGNLFNQMYNYWRERTMNYKRSWNVERSFDSVWGDIGFDMSQRLHRNLPWDFMDNQGLW